MSKPENTFFQRITRRKNPDEMIGETKKSNLNKSLGVFDLIMLGIGAVIGSGIFTLSGVAIAGSTSPAGPSFILSIMIAGFACILAALSYAEFAAMIPVSGSAYTYTFATFGELTAWLIGWVLMLEYAIGNITVAVGWSHYWFQFLKGFPQLPAFITNEHIWIHNLRIFDTIPVYVNIPALIMVSAVTALLYKGVQESTKTAGVMVMIKLLIIATFVIVGVQYVKPEHWVPFMPGGFKGIFTGAFTIFFAYMGFDAVSTAAEETKNPQRDMPIGIIGSLTICTLIYILVAAVLTGMFPGSQIIANQEFIGAPIAYAMRNINHNAIAGLISGGAVAGLGSVLLVLQLGTTRILFAMSRDKLLPSIFSKVHPTFKTPHIITLVSGFFVLMGTLVLNLEEAAHLCNIGTFTAFIIVSMGVIILRYRDPDRVRPFRVPFMPFLPILGILICITIICIGIPLKTFISFSVWLTLGLIIYFSYGYKKTNESELIEQDVTVSSDIATDVNPDIV